MRTKRNKQTMFTAEMILEVLGETTGKKALAYATGKWNPPNWIPYFHKDATEEDVVFEWLFCAFDWDETPEGGAYWWNVSQTLSILLFDDFEFETLLLLEKKK